LLLCSFRLCSKSSFSSAKCITLLSKLALDCKAQKKHWRMIQRNFCFRCKKRNKELHKRNLYSDVNEFSLKTCERCMHKVFFLSLVGNRVIE
jgi:hypothetical protein